MKMLRSIIAIVIGFHLPAIISMTFLLYMKADELRQPNVPPDVFDFSNSFQFALFVVGTLGYIVSGYVCAWIAGRKEWRHGYFLIGLMLLVNLSFMVLKTNPNPNHFSIWMYIAGFASNIGGVLLGVKLRLLRRAATQDFPDSTNIPPAT